VRSEAAANAAGAREALPPPTSTHGRRMPIGAEPVAGGVDFRVWAPKSRRVQVQHHSDLETFASEHKTFDLVPEEGGYFSGLLENGGAGCHYKYLIDGGSYPDPASRFQPAGPHEPSEVIDHAFAWDEGGWEGVSRRGQVIYEMHIGTFTRGGAWREALEELPELASLGVTVLELMPVAEFDGEFGWGYDGVDLFAPFHGYGRPEDFRAFVNRAHQLGIGVILDVVYNHLGPSGNYLRPFSDDYFSTRHMTEWGEAINFDGQNSGPVREFFIANAGYWISEFHLDGLRLDATQNIHDSSGEHIIATITREVRVQGGSRKTYIIAENEPQDVRLLMPTEAGGCDVDALWNDDFHHSAMVAATGRNEAYYTDYLGKPQEFVSTIKYGFLYQGQWYRWQEKHRGRASLDLHPERLVSFLQNHDQVANSLRGHRLHQITSPGELRALTTLLLLGPATPLLFQGQEFAASSPFLYFADHHPELAELVKGGRLEFLLQFPRIATPEAPGEICDPADVGTFRRSKLDFSERGKNFHIYQLHRDLLRLRRDDPVFSNVRQGAVDGAVLGHDAFLLRYFSESGDRLLLMNLAADLALNPAPEPLLAPETGCRWDLLWSSELPLYGGDGAPDPQGNPNWWLPARSALVLISVRHPDAGGEDL